MLQITNLHANVGDRPILKGFSCALALCLVTLPVSALANKVVEGPVLESRMPTGSVDIPDEIAPAVVPYLACLFNAVMEGIQNAGGGIHIDQMPAVEAAALDRCSAVRRSSAVEAEKLLEAYDGKFEPAARPAMIESALASIEAMFTDMVAKTKQFDDASSDTKKSNAEN